MWAYAKESSKLIMPLIPDRQKVELKRTLRTDLKGEVTLRLFTKRVSLLTIPGRECRSCSQTQELMEELVALSTKLHLETYDFYSHLEERDCYAVERIPAILLGKDNQARAKYYGIPGGQEFAALLETIKTISRGVSPLTMDSRKKLRRVNQQVHIQVFVTLNSALSPQIGRMAHAMALETPFIKADVVDTEEFPSLVQMYAIRSVPKTVINGLIQFDGPIAESAFVEKVLQAGVREPETAGA